MLVAILLVLVVYTDINAAQNCSKDDVIYSLGLSEEEKKEIVALHNADRLKIAHGDLPDQPQGMNLKKIEYDENLALLAREVILRCRFEHFRVRDPRWRMVGQNLYKEYSCKNTTEMHWAKALDAWFDEHEHYQYPVGSTNSKMVSHYTQVVWANTTYIGCDYMHFHNTSDTVRPHTKMYICHYGPPGNRRGKAPYISGSGKCENLC